MILAKAFLAFLTFINTVLATKVSAGYTRYYAILARVEYLAVSTWDEVILSHNLTFFTK
jgi:hypothetical protein